MSRKGIPNKLQHNVKANIEEVFDLLGGTHGFYAWAKDNPGYFYALYSKLLPKNIEVKAEVKTVGDLLIEQAYDQASGDANVIQITGKSE